MRAKWGGFRSNSVTRTQRNFLLLRLHAPPAVQTYQCARLAERREHDISTENGNAPTIASGFCLVLLYPSTYSGYPMKAIIPTLLIAMLCVSSQLIEAGENVNAKDSDGNTPLHWAAREGNADNVRQLIDAGAYVNARDRRGNTPLRRAALADQLQIVSILCAVQGREDAYKDCD